MSGTVKGWCPTTAKAMRSGDGLLVRLKPGFGRFDPAAGLRIADIARRFGNGAIDLTRRGSLQLRGIRESEHAALIEAAVAQGLACADETDLRIALDPFGGADHVAAAEALLAGMIARPEFAALPAKFGFAIGAIEGDIRLGPDGVEAALARAADWVRRVGRGRGPDIGAMPIHRPGLGHGGALIGAPFGRLDAQALSALATLAGVRGHGEVRLTPWRAVFVPGADAAFLYDAETLGFVTRADDPRLDVDVCVGAPECSSAEAETRDLALRLAPLARGRSIHVSGCAKGCARSEAADITIVGRAGRYDLVRAGRADAPAQVAGLTPDRIPEAIP